MPGRPADPLDELTALVLASSKYCSVSPDLVRRLGQAELAKGRKLKEAAKAVKNKLHQVGGAYLPAGTNYGQWLEELRAANRAPTPASAPEFREACLRIMGYHASTRERIPILDRFYAETLASLPPIRSVLDVACGLNPLAIPWMPLAEGAAYHVCDIYAGMVDFVEQYLALLGMPGSSTVCDLATTVPARRVDLALVLKVIPCLEQLDSAAGERLLDALDADWLLVSFPVRSLGGRGKGMVANYERRFRELVEPRGWPVQRFEFSTELAFLAHAA